MYLGKVESPRRFTSMAFFTLVNSVRSKVRPFSRNLMSSVTEAASINRVDKNRWKDRNVTFPLASSLDFAHSRLNEFFLPGAQARLDLSYLGHGHGFLDECVDQADAGLAGWLAVYLCGVTLHTFAFESLCVSFSVLKGIVLDLRRWNFSSNMCCVTRQK